MARCPLIRRCGLKVGFKHYHDVCSNITVDAYLNCEEFKRITAGTKTPLEWGEAVSPI